MTNNRSTPLPPQWFDTPAAAGSRVPRTPCQRDPVQWDVDRTGAAGLRGATRQCLTVCPVLDACRARVVDLRGRYRGRREGVPELAGMVWAGHVYDRDGVRVDLATDTRIGPVHHQDTRHVTDDGRVFDGHVGRWVPAPSTLRRRRPHS